MLYLPLAEKNRTNVTSTHVVQNFSLHMLVCRQGSLVTGTCYKCYQVLALDQSSWKRSIRQRSSFVKPYLPMYIHQLYFFAHMILNNVFKAADFGIRLFFELWRGQFVVLAGFNGKMGVDLVQSNCACQFRLETCSVCPSVCPPSSAYVPLVCPYFCPPSSAYVSLVCPYFCPPSSAYVSLVCPYFCPPSSAYVPLVCPYFCPPSSAYVPLVCPYFCPPSSAYVSLVCPSVCHPSSTYVSLVCRHRPATQMKCRRGGGSAHKESFLLIFAAPFLFPPRYSESNR
jgi:hypothetical protein